MLKKQRAVRGGSIFFCFPELRKESGQRNEEMERVMRSPGDPLRSLDTYAFNEIYSCRSNKMHITHMYA